MKSIKAMFRRGHKDGQGHQDNISRTSSVTNLDSLEANLQGQQGKGAKPRKVASKERIDKQTHDGKKVSKNNNKLEPPLPPTGQALSYSSDSLQEAEIQLLKKQLREMSDEKSSLALQLGEQRGQLNVLQKEIQKLKSFQDDSNLEMDKLAEENTALRNRLRDVAHSPLSDNEKQQLLFESRHHSSAPASIATNVVDDNGGDVTTCTTPDWDKHSSGNLSEVSVACLQDKINQMQETHYSTNEELQATLQELTDLQRQLTELQQENERLNEEKTLMFDSLCRQTERLNDSRQEVENLKQLLYRDRSDETGVNQLESVVEREQKLVELLRSAQEEREQLLLKLEQIQAELQDSRAENIDKADVVTQQSERVRTLEYTLDAKHAEHKQLDQELAQAKDQCSGKQIEINRLSDLLENARTKINELEQDRTLSDKSELDELLDNARKEKDQLESEVAYLKEQLARSKNEIEKLKEQVFVLQEECKVTRNNAKTTQSDLEYKCEKLVTEKNTLGEQLQQFQEALNEFQVQTQCHLEDKRQLSAVLSETQRNLSEAERRNLNLETEIQELKKLRAEENDEWEKFQNDLLTSVRVANDFKTEAQQELQKIILENKTYREKLRLLEGQVEKLKGENTSSSTQTDIILTPQLISLAKNLDQSITNRISLFEHPIPPTSLRSPTSPTSSMDKLFPILGKDRRSKSRENLADDLHKSSETSIRRSKSRDNLSSVDGSRKSSTKAKKVDRSKEKPLVLDEPEKDNRSFLKRNKSKDNLEATSKPVEESSKGSRSFFKRNKSKDNLVQFAEVDKGTSKKEEPSKASKSFLKRNKSKDDLEHLAEVDGGTSKRDEDSAKKETALQDKPRKSKDSIDSSSSSSKSDFSKPEFFSKFIKKRDKKLLSHRKTMSVEEGILLKSLENWYGNIDQNIPDEFLSKEDQAVKKLKILYEDDQLKERPVAHKPKEQLAISKPLLNSVVQNPKLEEIVRNPQVPTVETQVRESALEDTFTLVNEEQEDRTTTDGPRFRIRSEEIYTNIGPKSLGIHKSQSLDDLNVFEEYRTESELAPALYRAEETDNLATQEHFEKKRVPRYDSEIYPNDSVSNPRYSTRYHDVQLKEYVPNDLPKPNVYINYENLDEIVHKLPRDVPASKLTEEQKFALKLKLALDEAEKKNTLKKIKKKKKSIKGLEISEPTPESVHKNWKLKEIILNPGIKKAEEAKKDKFFLDLFDDTEKKRHSTDISSDIGELNEMERRPGLIKANSMISKSYEDISFSFVPENTLLHLYYGQKGQLGARPKTISDTSSSSRSFTSAEFNVETGKITQKWDIPTGLNVKQVTVRQKDEAVEAKEDLLYNETINKEKNKKKNKPKLVADNVEYKESLEQLKHDLTPTISPLEKNSQYKEGQDLWLKGSLERYKRDLNNMVKQIESDQLRDSIRRRAFLTSNFETHYQVAQTERVFDEYEVSPYIIYSESRRVIEDLEENTEPQQSLETQENFGSQNAISYVEDLDTEAVGETMDSETVDEAINISILNDIIKDFISNERKFSEGYTVDLQQNINMKPVERDFQSSVTGTTDTEDQYQTASFNENQQYEKIEDPVEVTEQSNTSIPKVEFRKEQYSVTDFVDQRRSYQVPHTLDDRRSLTVEEDNYSGSLVFKPVPKERNKVTLNFYDIRFQSPVEIYPETSTVKVVNTNEPIIGDSDIVQKKNVSITQDDMHDQNPIEVDKNDNMTIIQKSVDDRNNNEPQLTLMDNERWVEPKEPIIFQCPTGLIDFDALVSEEIENSYLWPVPNEKEGSHDIEVINFDQRNLFENQNLIIDHKNKDDGVSQVVIEEITYQLSSASAEPFELRNSLEIREIVDHDLDDAPNKSVLDVEDLDTEVVGETLDSETVDEAINISILNDIIKDFISNERKFSEGYTVDVQQNINLMPVERDFQSSVTGTTDKQLVDPIISHSEAPEITAYQPNEENIYSFHLVSSPLPQTAEIKEEYSYQEILKENQYGVVSPLDLRSTYRGVVKEYKEKFPSELTEETDETNADGSDVSDLEYQEDFIDEFFKPSKGFEHEFSGEVENVDQHVAETENIAELEIKVQDTIAADESVEIRRREEAVSQIDQEMQNIMEKYLHTRTSLLVKKSGVDIEEKNRELKSNLKKYDNSENLHEIDSGESKVSNEETKEDEDTENNEPLSLEDLKFIEEMKLRYSSADSVSPLSEESTSVPKITSEEIEYKYQHLTDEELDLIRSTKGDRDSRPLSDINARDLLLIDEISRRYFKDGSLPPSARSSLQEEKDVPKAVKKESEEIKEHPAAIDKISEINVDAKEHEITPPLPLSLPPPRFSKYKDQPSYSKYTGIENASRSTSSQSLEEVIEEEEISKSEDIVQAIEKTPQHVLNKSEISHLPPSLRPRKPIAQQPATSYQPHTKVIFRDKTKLSSGQGLPNRPSSTADRSSSNRLSDLIFKETIFVPVSESEMTSHSPNSPLSPGYKYIEGGTWRNHEKPDFKQTIVVPSRRKMESSITRHTNEITSPSLKSPVDHSFRETIFVPTTVDPKERPKSIITATKEPNKIGLKETMIIPAKQRPTSSSLETHYTSKDPPRSPQSETKVTATNKPGYHSYRETIIVHKPQESPEAKDQSTQALSLQKSITQSKSSSRSEVKVNFNKYSAIPKPIVTTTTIRTSERRSISDPFTPWSLDSGLTTYEPVYSNMNFSTNTYKEVFSSNIKKKPLPEPRSLESTPHNLAGTSTKLIHVNPKNDSFVNMTDSSENFREILTTKETASFKIPKATDFAQFQVKFSDNTALKEDKEENITPEHKQKNVSSDKLILVESKAQTDILRNIKLLAESKESARGSKIGKKSDSHNATADSLNTKAMAESNAKHEGSITSLSSPTVQSTTSITVTTKGEQLDISNAQSADYVLEEDIEDIERKPSDVEDSNVNLFTMDSHSSYDSYLELFKTKESKDFDDLKGRKSPVKDFFGMSGFAYVEELADENATSDVEDEAKPKIVDFVPLDDDTTPFFTKDSKESYDTLEREKTFHVLGQASKISDKVNRESANTQKQKDDYGIAAEKGRNKESDERNLETSLEILARKSSSFSKASSKSQTNTSRTSFSQAKKLFEALADANKDERPKTSVTTKSPARYSVRDSKSMDQMRTRVSVTKEGEVPALGETGLLIKDGAEGTEESKNK